MKSEVVVLVHGSRWINSLIIIKYFNLKVNDNQKDRISLVVNNINNASNRWIIRYKLGLSFPIEILKAKEYWP